LAVVGLADVLEDHLRHDVLSESSREGGGRLDVDPGECVKGSVPPAIIQGARRLPVRDDTGCPWPGKGRAKRISGYHAILPGPVAEACASAGSSDFYALPAHAMGAVGRVSARSMGPSFLRRA